MKLYIQWCGALRLTRCPSYLKQFIGSALQANFLEKLPQKVALQSLYRNCGESLNHNTLSHYY